MRDPRIFEQGAIIELDFDAQSGRRPAIVVSNLLFNTKRQSAVVCPIVRSDRDDPLHVRLDNATTKTTGVVLADQARSLDIESRNPRYVERATDDITAEVLDIIAGIIEVPDS